jgi:hypothetical protein
VASRTYFCNRTEFLKISHNRTHLSPLQLRHFSDYHDDRNLPRVHNANSNFQICNPFRQFVLILSHVGVIVDGFGLDNWIYCTSTYHSELHVITELSLIHTLYILQLHTHWGSQSSLGVSWQRIYNSLTVTTAHMKSSLHSVVPFLPFLLNHLQLPFQKLPQF